LTLEALAETQPLALIANYEYAACFLLKVAHLATPDPDGMEAMYLKFIFAFLSIGGAGYALIKVNETPFWLKAVIVMTAIAAFIVALPDLPRGFDAARETWNKIEPYLPHRSTPPTTTPTPTVPSPSDRDLPAVPPTVDKPLSSTPQTPSISTPPDVQPLGPSALPREPELQIQKNTQLSIFEGATYKLAAEKTYVLQAPLGYTVAYYIEDGSLTLYRDGKTNRRGCRDRFFKTFARISQYSVVPCTPTVVLRVSYVRLGDEIGPYSDWDRW
jgi:hypothetical protein